MELTDEFVQVADAYRRQATTAPKGKGKEDDEGGFW